MKVSNCTAVAAALSANYRNSEPFHPIENNPLNEYLDTHGVLLTMCMNEVCAIDPNRDTHISGSWINQKTGPLVIVNTNVGYILDPQHASIACLYPTDAGTAMRDDQGCGAVAMDPNHGSKGYAKTGRIGRWEMKLGLERYLGFNFDSKDIDIPCEAILGTPSTDFYCIWKGKETNMTFSSFAKQLADEFTPFLGRTFCNYSSIPDPMPSSSPFFYFYYDYDSWKPSEFQDMVDKMMTFVPKSDSKHLLWNEIVIKFPARLKDIVQAVFYIPSHVPQKQEAYRRKAHMQAKALGNVPVLVMSSQPTNNNNGDLFSCDHENDPFLHIEASSKRKDLPPNVSPAPRANRFQHPLADLIASVHSKTKDVDLRIH